MSCIVFQVLKPGPHTLIQDAGRRGVLNLGLTSAGPMDRLSFNWANRLCGNPAGSAALEITFGGLELKARGPALIAITGPDVEATLNGKTVPTWQGLRLVRGDRLHIGHVRYGCRLYLALAGGFAGQLAFGSAATVPREALGGIKGRALAAGDKLARAGQEPAGTRRFAVPSSLRPHWTTAPASEAELRVIPCLQARQFSRAAKRLFFAQSYRVSPHCDRMGYRLEGKPLAVPSVALLSEGITPGAIQLPADGLPIVLMRDHQTLGGYPRVGVVISTDLDLLAQLPPGAKVRFVPVTLHAARHILHQTWRHFEASCPVALEQPPL
ncbi:MAG: biotin-dependent carboxyltransferase family protein [Porticoccaceae bacterium]|nr:biotin-dependent carboxyltransferase family protein [Porticoccaceae bacterium]